MNIEMLNLHIIIVTLFLLFFLFKTTLLVLGKKALLKKIRVKTKGLEISLGILIIATGAYLVVVIGSLPTYLLVKIILVIMVIPLGIVGLKQENKFIVVLALLILIYVYALAETNNVMLNVRKHERGTIVLDKNLAGDILNANIDASLQQGKVIYKVLCVECHGEDGAKISLNGANLKESQLSQEESVEIITHGKGAMHGYEAELSEQEITLVASFTETLKK